MRELMDKREELRYSVVVLFIILSSAFVIIFLPAGAITGSAVAGDVNAVKKEVGKLVTEFPLIKYADNADMCIMVPISEQEYYSYNVIKRGTTVEITDSQIYCDGAENEDFIFGYITYDAFKESSEQMSCDKFKNGNAKDFYFFISKYVKSGGSITCTEGFKENYCPALSYCMSAAELAGIGLSCCFELSPEKQKLAEQAARAGIRAGQRETSPEVQQPAATQTSFVLFAIIAVVAVLIIGGVAFYLIEKQKGSAAEKKPENAAIAKTAEKGIPAVQALPQLPGISPEQVQSIVDYAKSCKDQRFTEEQVIEALVQSGWNEINAGQIARAAFGNEKANN